MSLGVYRQVGSLGEVLSEQTVGVLVGTPLPRTARVAEVNIDVGRQANRISLSAAFRDGIRHLGVDHGRNQLNLVGRGLSKNFLQNVGTFIGFWPNKHIVSRFTGHDAKFVVFTINDPLKMKLYIDAGFEAIGTDDPYLLISVLQSLGLTESVGG